MHVPFFLAVLPIYFQTIICFLGFLALLSYIFLAMESAGEVFNFLLILIWWTLHLICCKYELPMFMFLLKLFDFRSDKYIKHNRLCIFWKGSTFEGGIFKIMFYIYDDELMM